MRNFGLIANYTNVKSEVNFGTPAQPIIRNLNGLSEEAFNLTFYFENDRVSARVSLSDRDEFQRNATSRAGNDLDFTESATNMDFSAAYTFSERLKFTLEAINLTDEYRTDLMDSVAGRLENYQHTGTQYYLGVQFSY